MVNETSRRLKDLARIESGHHSRSRIRYDSTGSHWLLSSADAEPGIVELSNIPLRRFHPKLSSGDCPIEEADVLFMARGTQNYACQVHDVPPKVLVPSSFFIIRVIDTGVVLPDYILWWLNQPRAKHHFKRFGGQGVNMPVVRREVLEAVRVHLPTLDRQRIIAKVSECASEERRLTNLLAVKRMKLADALCRRALHETIEEP